MLGTAQRLASNQQRIPDIPLHPHLLQHLVQCTKTRDASEAPQRLARQLSRPMFIAVGGAQGQELHATLRKVSAIILHAAQHGVQLLHRHVVGAEFGPDVSTVQRMVVTRSHV